MTAAAQLTLRASVTAAESVRERLLLTEGEAWERERISATHGLSVARGRGSGTLTVYWRFRSGTDLYT